MHNVQSTSSHGNYLSTYVSNYSYYSRTLSGKMKSKFDTLKTEELSESYQTKTYKFLYRAIKRSQFLNLEGLNNYYTVFLLVENLKVQQIHYYLLHYN